MHREGRAFDGPAVMRFLALLGMTLEVGRYSATRDGGPRRVRYLRAMYRVVVVGLAVAALAVISACGAATEIPPQVAEAGGGAHAPAVTEEAPQRSSATGMEQLSNVVLTEADAGRVIEAEYYSYDIGLPNKKGLEIILTGDDASTLRWSMPVKPDPQVMEWHAVDGKLAFETDGLVGDPATAAKVLEFRGTKLGETRVVLELVERDPAKRSGAPAKRLEYTFQVPTPRFRAGLDVPGFGP